MSGDDIGLVIRRLTGSYGDVVQPATRTRVFGGYWDMPQETGRSGVDVAIEATGNSLALHQAIRVTRYGGTIGVISSYSKDAAGLRLGDEFHVNGQSIVSIRAESLPLRDAPHWNRQRLVDIGLRWMLDGRIRTTGIVTPIVPFDEAVEAYRHIDEHPEESIKLGVRFP